MANQNSRTHRFSEVIDARSILHTGRMRKGISPLIAAVLLIAFTMAVATIAGPWMTNLLQNTQQGVSDQAVDVTRAANLGLKIMSVEFDRGSNELQVTVQNTGEAIDNKTNVSISVIGGSVAKTQQYDVDLSENEITTLNLPVDRTYPLDTVQAAMTGYPVSTEKGIKCTPTNELVGYWTFSSAFTKNNWLKDVSPPENNGSLELSPDVGVKGRVGGAYRFNGSNYVRAEEGLTAKDITLSGWVRYSPDATGDSPNFGNPIIEDNGDYTAGLFADMESNNQRFYIYPDDASSSTNIAASISKGKWYFVTGVRDGKSIKLYINGERRITGSTTDGLLTIPNWDFAHPADGSAAFLQGKIDDVRVYNRSLSQSEILRLYQVRSESWAVDGCKLTS